MSICWNVHKPTEDGQKNRKTNICICVLHPSHFYCFLKTYVSYFSVPASLMYTNSFWVHECLLRVLRLILILGYRSLILSFNYSYPWLYAVTYYNCDIMQVNMFFCVMGYKGCNMQYGCVWFHMIRIWSYVMFVHRMVGYTYSVK